MKVGFETSKPTFISYKNIQLKAEKVKLISTHCAGDEFIGVLAS